MKFAFIADFFADEILGGGELNNQELIEILREREHEVIQIKSAFVTPDFIKTNSDSFFIIANFIMLSEDCKRALADKNYLNYEHDHKYLPHRNPARCKECTCPAQHIIYRDFYKSAKAVLCQSQFHSDIVNKNLNIGNVVNLGGNLWSLDSLSKMREIGSKEKQNKCSILDSNISHKNTIGAIQQCSSKGYEYELIKSNSYYEFLQISI